MHGNIMHNMGMHNMGMPINWQLIYKLKLSPQFSKIKSGFFVRKKTAFF